MGVPNSSINDFLTGSRLLALANIEQKASSRDTLLGNVATVTSGAAVMLIASIGSPSYKPRTVDVRPIGGDIYISHNSGVGSSQGKLVKDGEVWSEKDYSNSLYAIAVGGTVQVRYDYCYRA